MLVRLRWCFSSVGALPLADANSDDSSAGHEIEDEHDDGENQKDMNPPSQCVAAN